MYSVFAKNTSGIHGNTYRIHVFQEYIENTKNTKRYYMYSVFILIENTPKSNRKHPQSPPPLPDRVLTLTVPR
jgi:hypothetical protein